MHSLRNNAALPYLMIATGAALWGIIGIFIFQLDQTGFTSLEIVTLRVVSASVMLFIYIRIRYPDKLKISFSHIHYFLGTGIFSITFFNWCYFIAIKETGLTVAVILLYTGPAFVVMMAAVLFKEKLTPQKVTALFLTFAGAAMVVGLIPFEGFSLSLLGILAGIGSGFGYALYSVFSKYALEKYEPVTIIFYTFLTASVFLIPVSGILNADSLQQLSASSTLWNVIGLGFFPTALAYLLYTEGLSKVEAGNASITSMTEPVAATLIGVFVYGDILQIPQIFGIVLVLLSIIFIQIRKPVARKSL